LRELSAAFPHGNTAFLWFPAFFGGAMVSHSVRHEKKHSGGFPGDRLHLAINCIIRDTTRCITNSPDRHCIIRFATRSITDSTNLLAIYKINIPELHGINSGMFYYFQKKMGGSSFAN
jgi:hypothetical protein